MQGPKLYGVAEFAEALGWDRSRVSKYLTREAVPEPYARLASGPVWTEEQVKVFIKEGKKMSGEDLKMWPVRPREDVPYLLGRVCAVAGHTLELSGHNADKDVQLASTSTGALGQMVGRATVAAGGLGSRGEELKELIGEIMGSLRGWPEELSNEEQAEWWLGYYHQKTALAQQATSRDDLKAALLANEAKEQPTKLLTIYDEQWVYGPKAGTLANQSENPDCPLPATDKWGVTDGQSEPIEYPTLEALLDAVLEWEPILPK